MAMDSSECNGSGDAPKVELEGKAGVEFGSEKDLAKFDGIASTEREVNDRDGIGGPFVIINGDSDNLSEKNLELNEKVDPETTGEDKVSTSPPINAGDEIGVTEVEEEAELKSGSDPAQGEPILENSVAVGSESGEKVEKESEESTENGELSENRTNNVEFESSVEKKESSEDPVVEEISQGKGKELELSGAGQLEDKKGVNFGMPVVETVREENGSQLVSESVENGEEEHPISGSIECAEKENGKMHESGTIVGEPDQPEELDISSLTVREQIPQEVEPDMSILPLKQDLHGESEGSSDTLEGQEKAETPVTELKEHPTLDLTAEAESEQKHEVRQEVSITSQEEEIQEESEGLSGSLQCSKEVEMPETKSKELPLLDSTVEVESKQKHEVQQEVSSPSQEEEMHEETEGVPDSLQSNKELDVPGTESNNQPPSDSAVKVESQQEHEVQQEASCPSQEEEMHEETEEVTVPSEGKKEFVEASEAEIKVKPSSDYSIEAESKEAYETVVETTHQDLDTTTTVNDGRENGEELEISPSPILVEGKHAPGPTSPDQEKLAESDKKQVSAPLEPKDESETVVSDTVADKEALSESESTSEVEEMQKPEGGDAVSDTLAVSASAHEIEVVESCSEVLPESENRNTSEAEESEKSMTESEDGPSKTEAETVSVSSNDASARDFVLDDSVQIGNFKISIGENGPAILQEEMQEGAEMTQAAAPEELGTSTLDGEKPEVQPLKRQMIYIIKVPRYSNEVQWEKIQEAQARLDELTRTRDAIRDIIQKRRRTSSDSWDEVLKAKEEERAARAVFNAKRHEISNVQSVINKLNKANSIDDMDDLIEMKEKSLQHETMTLKQEKMLMQEIKELKAQRKKLVENMGSAAEIDEAFDQKDSVFDRLKTLKTELEVLGNTLAKAEAKTKAAQKAYEDIDTSYCKLQDDHKSADEVRQKAYFHWRGLKSELAKKNEHFFNYRDDQKRAASLLGNPTNIEGLRLHCNRQVEKMMELWNNDTEFRKQYIESNKISTLRRLRTLDGRSLGPDEVPPVIPTTSTYRRTSTPVVPASKEIRLQKPTRVLYSPSIQSDQFPELPQPKSKISPNNNKNNKATTSKETVVDQRVVTDREAVAVSVIEIAKMEKIREEEEMERRKRDEVAERARREEEIKRKAEAEAEEKERLREEQKAKAKEAEERKKRKAEKAQERAEFKARKEAEIRDKKRAKKDKKKAGGSESDNGDTPSGPASDSSTPSETAQIKETPPAAPTTATRRPTRPQVVMKQLKRVEPVPVALRNRSRRKVRSWIIAIATAFAAVVTVFFIGNFVNFSDISSLVWL